MVGRIYFKRISASLVAMLFSLSVMAEEKPALPAAVAPPVAGDELGTTSFQRIPSELASPWTTAARPWLLWGTAMTLGFLTAEDSGNKTQEQMAKDKPLGDWAVVGDYAGQLIPNALYVAGMYGTYWFNKDVKYKKHGLIMIKASAYAGAASTVLKVLIKEQRPNKGKDWTSFPSGHSTTAFAFAAVVSAEHGFWPYGLMATTLATLTGVSRMNDNMHHAHDVAAGATLGTAFGLGVSYINAAFDRKEWPVAVAPMLQDGFAGMQIVLPFK